MLIEATTKPIRYRLKSGQEVLLQPGVPVELPDEAAADLLMQAPGKVRQIETEQVTTEPAALSIRPVFFERADGRIYGPATVTDFAKTGAGTTERYWVIVELEGLPAWVRSDRLRSQQQFERQVKPMVIEPIKEPT